MKCPEFTLKEVDLHKWRIFFQDSLMGETSFPVPSEKIGRCIVQAINSHKKLVEASDHAYSFMICVTNLDNEENLEWQEDITKELKQALEESEKE